MTMVKNKDNRSFLYKKEEELDLYFQRRFENKGPDAIVPNELEGRIRSVIRNTANREQSIRRRAKRTLTAAASIILLASIITVSPTLSANAKQWLSLQVPKEWMKVFQSYAGIREAKNHDYQPIPPVTVEKDGITVSIENIYLEENKLSYYAAFKGAYEQQKGFVIVSADFPNAGMSASTTSLKDENDEIIDVANVSQTLVEKEVVDFIQSKPKYLTFKVIQTASWDRPEKHFMDIRVPFDATVIVKSKNITINQNYIIEDSINVALDNLTVSPTEMTLQFHVQAPEGTELLLDNYRGDDHPYITDREGKEYASRWLRSLRNVITFYPSAFFMPGKELTLHINKVWLTDLKDKQSFDIQLNVPESYPKIVSFRNQSITILGARFKEGYLYLDVRKEEPQKQDLEPWKIEFDNYYDKVNQDPELVKLYQEKYKFYSSDSYGRSYPKLDTDGKEVLDMYEVMIMAPEQERYSLDIYRYEDPVEWNQTVTVKVP